MLKIIPINIGPCLGDNLVRRMELEDRSPLRNFCYGLHAYNGTLWKSSANDKGFDAGADNEGNK